MATLKARLLAGFCAVLLLAVPLNAAKILWLDLPDEAVRINLSLLVAVVAAVSLVLVLRGHLPLASNGLPAALIIPAKLILHFSGPYAQPLGLGFQVFAYDLVAILVAVVFASRSVALALLAVVIAGHLFFHDLMLQHLTGDSAVFAGDSLFREGAMAFCLVFALGAVLVRAIDGAYHRNQELLHDMFALNQNLEHVVGERTRKLVQLNAEQRDFIGMAAHDLRNPAVKIRMIAEMIPLGREYSEPRTRADLDQIIATTHGMLTFLNNLLDATAIEEDRFPLRIVPRDAAGILRHAHADFVSRAAAKQIDLVFVPPEFGGISVLVDPIAIRQILDNLISNALKFSPPGRRVWASAEILDGGRVTFAIRDEGPGLSEADRAKLFGKYTRLSAQPTAGESSNGLGLSIVKRLTEKMSGTIAVTSTPGQGATFRVSFPAVRSDGLPG